MILGLNYYQNKNHSYSNSLISSSYNKVTISNGIYDTLTLGVEYDPTYDNCKLLIDNVPEEFSNSSILFAEFNGNINAGNIEYKIGETNYFKLKRREKGSLKWNTLSIQDVKLDEIVDNRFSFSFKDITARSGKTYEYAVVPVTYGVESETFNFDEIECKFCGIVIADKNLVYQTELEAKVESARNGNSTHVTTIGKRCPYLCSIGNTNYDSGTLYGMFVPNEDCNYINVDFEHAWEYRNGLIDMLNSGRPLILKHYDGRAWIIGIEGEISNDDSEHHDKVITSATWKEIGNVDSYEDMVACGLTDALL